MLMYPHIDPVAFRIGPLAVHWYGLMYLVGILGGWRLGVYRARQPNSGWTANEVADLIFYAALGVILGGRLGYVLFYDLSYSISNPVSVFYTWKGGMSFHGGLIGVAVSIYCYCRKFYKPFLTVADFIAPLVPIGLAAGRIGNFINGELWGRVTDVAWGMVYPPLGVLPLHPSQLYEFLLEGVSLFIILWIYSAKPRPAGAVSGLFLVCYGIFRIFCEFFRQPDIQWGYLSLGWVTMGQLLCVPMIILGVGMLMYTYRCTKCAKPL